MINIAEYYEKSIFLENKRVYKDLCVEHENYQF